MRGARSAASPLFLSLEPSFQTHSVGDVFAVDVVVQGLDPADSTELVSAFDLDIVFDASIVEVTGVTFGTSLGADFDQFSDAVVTNGVLDMLQTNNVRKVGLMARPQS